MNNIEIFEGMEFRAFDDTDVKTFTPIFRRAFDNDSQMHLNVCGGPDGYKDGRFLKQWYLANRNGAFAVYKKNTPIGGINVFVDLQKKEGFLGNIFIDTDYEDSGIGALCWKFIEYKFPQIKTWFTETPKYSTRNHHFYVNKCGFKIWKIENPKERDQGQYFLEKIMY
ncbi:MAG: GNAT family N-acetyltransferase [Lachnospiraceae bacterium]|jgi:hypothetical protein|nr:GNAT family N-acetyltransferase [Lachnospiraceae bacterium]